VTVPWHHTRVLLLSLAKAGHPVALSDSTRPTLRETRRHPPTSKAPADMGSESHARREAPPAPNASCPTASEELAPAQLSLGRMLQSSLEYPALSDRTRQKDWRLAGGEFMAEGGRGCWDLESTGKPARSSLRHALPLCPGASPGSAPPQAKAVSPSSRPASLSGLVADRC